MQQNRNISDSELTEAYHQEKTLGKIAAKFNLSDITVWRRCKKLGLTFQNGGHDKGQKKLTFLLDDILSGKHPQYPTPKLKKRLLREGYLQYHCNLCKISEWNGKEVSLQLDHINGNPKDHSFSNLRLLCPNCHSQTPTWCGKNI